MNRHGRTDAVVQMQVGT